MGDTYLTIKGVSEGLYKEKGSKFLAFAYHVSSVDEVKEILEQMRKRYYDARHVCYAYMLGCDRTEYRANDDGEPSSTAGKPILGQINAAGLTNVLVVVVRYFGGILLGTGGLTTAYKEASADAIAHADVQECVVTEPLIIVFPYEQTNLVQRLLKEQHLDVAEREFEASRVVYRLAVKRSQVMGAKALFQKNRIAVEDAE